MNPILLYSWWTTAAKTSLILPPLIESPLLKVMAILIAYVVTLVFSTAVVTKFISPSPPPETLGESDTQAHATEERRHLGNIIGKCENIIIVTLVLVHAETALALIFAAKALVRRQDIEQDPGYFLGGTLINFVWSLGMALIARVLIAGL
jgi:hypothetical protein